MSTNEKSQSESNQDSAGTGLPNTTTRSALLINESDQTFRQMVQNLVALCGRIDQVRNRFAKRLGISGPQYNVLLFVAQNQGREGITVSKVADGLLVTGAYVTKEVNQLIVRGLITKTPNPEDGRSVLLRLSEHGSQSLAALAPALQTVNDEMFGSLDQDRFLAISGTVHQLLMDAEKTARKVSFYLDD
ncbi:MAG: MarR family winged helix-turn-helix transcriptional regulator [Pseudomonadota bacterium]